jgi:hypothetical protein
MREEEAVGIALAGLAHIAGDEAALTRFMTETGIDGAGLRARAGEPALLGAVLDFLFADEALLMDFCKSNSVPPGAVIKARAALPGGSSALDGWT